MCCTAITTRGRLEEAGRTISLSVFDCAELASRIAPEQLQSKRKRIAHMPSSHLLGLVGIAVSNCAKNIQVLAMRLSGTPRNDEGRMSQQSESIRYGV